MKNNDLGKFIYELRKENNLTQKELADKINVTDKAVSRWENGKNYPDIEMLQSLGEIFGVSVSELLEGQRLEQEQLVIQSNNRMVKEIKKSKGLKKFLIAFTVFVLVMAIIGAALVIKEDTNPIIENHLDMKSSDVRSLLDNINAFIDPQESNDFTLTDFRAFINTDKETSDLYCQGICNEECYYGVAFGLDNDLEYTKVYKYKEKVTHEQRELAYCGVSCLDFIDFINNLDFTAIDDTYSQSNTYHIDFESGEYLEEIIEINDDSKRYVYSIKDKTMKQVEAGYKIVGEYAYAVLESVYEGTGTMLAFIYIEL